MPTNIDVASAAEKKAAKAAYDREYRRKNAEKIKANKKVWGQSEKKKAYDKRWAEENRDRSNEIKKAWRSRNPEKEAAYVEANRARRSENARVYYMLNAERIKQKTIEWRANNPERASALSGKRRLAVVRATPGWANRARMNEIYKSARALGLEVDHVIPLQGKTVCGLHVESNLRPVTKAENRKKGANHAH